MVNIVNNVLSLLTIGSQIATVLLVVSFLAFPQEIKKIKDFFLKHFLLLAFIVSFTATLGSLFYSEIAGFEPCKLCWFERIFMYPQTFLLGIALWKKDKGIIIYSLVLSVIGILISAYHYLLQIGVTSSLPCAVVGYSAACSQRFVLQYGYITIPMMALTAFTLIFLLMLFSKTYKKK